MAPGTPGRPAGIVAEVAWPDSIPIWKIITVYIQSRYSNNSFFTSFCSTASYTFLSHMFHARIHVFHASITHLAYVCYTHLHEPEQSQAKRSQTSKPDPEPEPSPEPKPDRAQATCHPTWLWLWAFATLAFHEIANRIKGDGPDALCEALTSHPNEYSVDLGTTPSASK